MKCNAAYMRVYMRRRRLETPTRPLWDRARKRARERGVDFSIARTSIAIPAVCPALGIPIKVGGSRSLNSPSLDRVLPSRGYVPGNVRVISDQANRLKGDRTLAELKVRAAEGPVELRRDYALVAAYVDREALLSEVWAKAEQGGRAGEEWAKIARALDRLFSRTAPGEIEEPST